MTPQALFLYLSQTRHFTEDVAQEVIIAYLAQDGIQSPKSWAIQYARRLAANERKKTGRLVVLETDVEAQGPDALTRASQRQQIVRHWNLDLRKV